MAKEEGIEMEGVVSEVLPDRNYRVVLENGHEVLAYAAGKMSKFKIRVLEGDRGLCPASRPSQRSHQPSQGKVRDRELLPHPRRRNTGRQLLIG